MTACYTLGTGERVVVPLAHPFVVDGRMIDALTVAPPTLDALVWLRDLGAVGPCELVMALTGVGAAAAGALRWTDAEPILAAGLPMLPDDLRSIVEDLADLGTIVGGVVPDADAMSDGVAFAPAPPVDVGEGAEMTDFLHRTDGLIRG